jgi:hypothetical protein
MSAHQLHVGSAVPHFKVSSVTGEEVSYATIWQRLNLVLVSLPAGGPDPADGYIADLTKRLPEFAALDAACIVTREPIAGISRPSVVVADRWGEVFAVAAAPRVDALPSSGEILAWVEHIRHRCPECEGEAR